MKTQKFLLMTAVVVSAFSCGNNEHTEQAVAVTDTVSTVEVEEQTPPPPAPRPREEFISEIKDMEGEMFKASELDNSKANDAIKLYTDYALYFPADTLAPEYLFKAGEVATASKKYKRALEQYETILSKYPEYKHYKETMYLKAFLLDNFLNDDAAAKVVYEQVIAKYPTTNYAKDAKAAIQNLGKTDEQLMEEIKKKNGK